MFLTPFTIITAIALLTALIFSVMCALMVFRMFRITKSESQIIDATHALDTTQLKIYLQTIPITVIEIDQEVAQLKADIIRAANKHHLTLDSSDTQSESPFNTPQNREQLINVVEQQNSKTA